MVKRPLLQYEAEVHRLGKCQRRVGVGDPIQVGAEICLPRRHLDRCVGPILLDEVHGRPTGLRHFGLAID
eukprot:CAMPEP_0180550992 /NCGR_PEP_ID=MMETSP1036_2-20121128/72948_1 /TAXON_ID=632150 /ORGANISM="Azadinium spinosum, Strain 3D9" /LENGTH=69 /DNA_ID=CAMNT_0022566297 /DNA_START=284 /DNA_END=493 /DNA_ORIENTATION=+